jgi:hypothetical protein
MRLKFNAIGNKSLHDGYEDAGGTSRTIADWIVRALNGDTAIANLPTSMVDVNLSTKVGSLSNKYTVTFDSYTGSSSGDRYTRNWIQVAKQHNDNANFSSILRWYQTGQSNTGGSHCPRYFSNNLSNTQPSAVTGDMSWFFNTQGSHSSTFLSYFNNLELQVFASDHWFIFAITDQEGNGGTFGLFDVESTGADVYARSLNTLYSPQFFMTSIGKNWPTSTSDQVIEDTVYQHRTGLFLNQSYGGEQTFTNRGSIASTRFAGTYGSEDISLWPDTRNSIFNTVDAIGDTQNYLVPVYFSGINHLSTNNLSSDRILLNGRVPFLWRTSDNAGQTGQTATISGTEYRFVRIHPTGGSESATVGQVNAATYMVPTTIGGI